MYFKRDYGLTEEQKDLQAMVHEFAEKEIKPRAAEWDVNGSFSDDVLEMAKEGTSSDGCSRKIRWNGT